MGNESDKKPQQLTLNDPMDAATLKRIGEIQSRRFQLGDMLLDLEQERVKILVEGRRLDEERQQLFSQALTSRGLKPNVPVEVDPETGKISLIQMNGPMPAPRPPTEAQAPQPQSPGTPQA